MKKLLLLFALLGVCLFPIAACEGSSAADDELMAQQVAAAVAQQQAMSLASFQYQWAQQQLAPLQDQERLLQNQVNNQNMIILNANQMIQQLKTSTDPAAAKEIEKYQTAIRVATSTASDFQDQLDALRLQMAAYQKIMDDSVKTINDITAGVTPTPSATPAK